jgi:hypothetical protein
MRPYLKAAEQSWKAREPQAPKPESDVVHGVEEVPPRRCKCGAEIKNTGRFCDACTKNFKRKNKKPKKW